MKKFAYKWNPFDNVVSILQVDENNLINGECIIIGKYTIEDYTSRNILNEYGKALNFPMRKIWHYFGLPEGNVVINAKNDSEDSLFNMIYSKYFTNQGTSMGDYYTIKNGFRNADSIELRDNLPWSNYGFVDVYFKYGNCRDLFFSAKNDGNEFFDLTELTPPSIRPYLNGLFKDYKDIIEYKLVNHGFKKHHKVFSENFIPLKSESEKINCNPSIAFKK